MQTLCPREDRHTGVPRAHRRAQGRAAELSPVSHLPLHYSFSRVPWENHYYGGVLRRTLCRAQGTAACVRTVPFLIVSDGPKSTGAAWGFSGSEWTQCIADRAAREGFLRFEAPSLSAHGANLGLKGGS